MNVAGASCTAAILGTEFPKIIHKLLRVVKVISLFKGQTEVAMTKENNNIDVLRKLSTMLINRVNSSCTGVWTVRHDHENYWCQRAARASAVLSAGPRRREHPQPRPGGREGVGTQGRDVDGTVDPPPPPDAAALVVAREGRELRHVAGPRDQRCGLSIGLVLASGTITTGSVSRVAFNPAVALGLYISVGFSNLATWSWMSLLIYLGASYPLYTLVVLEGCRRLEL